MFSQHCSFFFTVVTSEQGLGILVPRLYWHVSKETKTIKVLKEANGKKNEKKNEEKELKTKDNFFKNCLVFLK